MALFETVEIDEMVTACSGSGGALGHPRNRGRARRTALDRGGTPGDPEIR